MHRRTLLSLALSLAIAPVADLAAQSAPNFTGKWTLNLTRSDDGGMPVGPRTDVIEHEGARLVVARTIRNGTSDDTSRFTYVIDGQSHKNRSGPAEVTSKLKWDGGALLIESEIAAPQGTYTFRDHYSLSADAKTLTIARRMMFDGEEMVQRLVFDRGS